MVVEVASKAAIRKNMYLTWKIMNNEYNTINYNNKRTIDEEIRKVDFFWGLQIKPTHFQKYFIIKYIWVVGKPN